MRVRLCSGVHHGFKNWPAAADQPQAGRLSRPIQTYVVQLRARVLGAAVKRSSSSSKAQHDRSAYTLRNNARPQKLQPRKTFTQASSAVPRCGEPQCNRQFHTLRENRFRNFAESSTLSVNVRKSTRAVFAVVTSRRAIPSSHLSKYKEQKVQFKYLLPGSCHVVTTVRSVYCSASSCICIVECSPSISRYLGQGIC